MTAGAQRTQELSHGGGLQRPPALVVAPTTRELGGMERKGRLPAAVLGIGSAASSSLASIFDACRPSLVVSLGFAGALAPGLRSGTLCLPESVSHESGLPGIEYSKTARSSARSVLRTAGLQFIDGPLLTVESPLLTPASKQANGSASNAIAVDMEGYWLAEAAEEAGIPMIAVRVILDEVDQHLPQMIEALIADHGRHEWLHVVRSLRNPRTAASLMVLAAQAHRARGALRRALNALEPPFRQLDMDGQP